MPFNKIEKELAKNNPLRSAKEQKQNRLIIIGFIITAILIVGFAGYALIYEFFIKTQIPVARVNNTKIDNTYFIERVKLERNAFIQQYQMLNAQYEFMATDEESSQYYLNQMLQMQQMLGDYEYFGEVILENIINDEIIAQQAEKLGISISEQDIEETIQQIFAYYPKGTPTPEPIPTTFPTPTLSLTQQALLNYTPTPSTPNETDDAESTADSTISNEISSDVSDDESDQTEEVNEGESVAESEAISTPTEEISPTGTSIPTATPYTEELYRANYNEYFGELEGVGVSEKSLRTYIRNFLLTQKLQEEIVKEVPQLVEQVWARHILVETEDDAEDVINRLNKGEDWSIVAEEVSLDDSNKSMGGDLGWFPRGNMVAEFEDVAFNLEIGETSDPVQTQFGWHIIQVIGKDELPLNEWDYQEAQQIFFQEWFDEQKEQAEIVINDVWKDIVPTEPSLQF